MNIYTNLTNFMNHEGISYSDRVVLEILRKIIEQGHSLKAFFKCEAGYKLLEEQVVLEYFFTKNVKNKKKYCTNIDFIISNISHEDCYFEVDVLYALEEDWNAYYSELKKTDCSMYSYIYFGLNYEIIDKNQFDIWKENYLRNIEKIYMSDISLKNEYFGEKSEINIELVVLPLDKFAIRNHQDDLLEIDKGFNRIIKGKKYVFFLPDVNRYQYVVSELKKISDKYGECNLLIYFPPEFNNSKIEKYINKLDELGNKIFLLKEIDYYTILNLYLNAQKVLINSKNKNCKYELVNIEKIGASIQMI